MFFGGWIFEEEIRRVSHLGTGGMFAIYGFALLLGHRFRQANVEVGDVGDGELIALLRLAQWLDEACCARFASWARICFTGEARFFLERVRRTKKNVLEYLIQFLSSE